MRTEKIKVDNSGQGLGSAMEEAEKFASALKLDKKSQLRLRLLTEEVISMIHGILDVFRGKFWLESEQTKKGLLCRICLLAEKQANQEQEAHFLSVSSSGKNENAKGVMARIRELFRRSLQCADDEDEKFLLNMSDTFNSSGHTAHDTTYWSLQLYRQNVAEKKNERKEEWDELEKSIIAKLADEVRVWLKADATEIVVEKLIAL